jgi:hypothetical protein
MREISQGNALVDSAPQQFVDARAAALVKRPAIGVAALGMIDSRDKKHQLRRLVAGIVGTVSKVYASPLQGADTPLDGGAHGLGGHGRGSPRSLSEYST